MPSLAGDWFAEAEEHQRQVKAEAWYKQHDRSECDQCKDYDRLIPFRPVLQYLSTPNASQIKELYNQLETKPDQTMIQPKIDNIDKNDGNQHQEPRQ